MEYLAPAPPTGAPTATPMPITPKTAVEVGAVTGTSLARPTGAIVRWVR
jgi:hypothetical protein